jgi:hypothetical protein
MLADAASIRTSRSAVLFQINNAASVPAFSYSADVDSNNVVNDTNWTASQQAALGTGSTIFDGSHTADWKGTASGGPNAFLSVTGLFPGQTYTVGWIYAGSQSANTIRFSVPAAANILNNGAASTDGDNRNNNCCGGINPSSTLGMGSTAFVNDGTNIVGFTIADLNNGATLTNGGPNPVPTGSAANLIFSYANFNGAAFTLTDTPTNFVAFAFNDSGSNDHDDFIGVAALLGGGPCQCDLAATPIPPTFLLFVTGLGVLGLLRWLNKSKIKLVCVQAPSG